MENFRLTNEERFSIAERLGDQVAKLPRQEQRRVASALRQCIEALEQHIPPTAELPRKYFTTYGGKSALAYYLLLLQPERNFFEVDPPLTILQGTRYLSNEEKFALARQVGVFVATLNKEEQEVFADTLQLCVLSLGLKCDTDCIIRPEFFNSHSQRCVLAYYMLLVLPDIDLELTPQ